MSEAKVGDKVQVEYVAKTSDGSTVESTHQAGPIEFTIGERQTIPGMENAVIGMEPGERKTEVVPPSEAFGPRRQELILSVDAQRFPEELEPSIGQRVRVTSSDGQTRPATVTEVREGAVVLDANHPLAGEELVLEIKLVAIA